MKKLFLSFIAIATIALFSCNKEETAVISTEDEAIVANDAAAEAVTDASDAEVELFTGSNESIELIEGTLKTGCPFVGRYVDGQCPIVTVERTEGTFPITVTIDYGEGVTLFNGTVIKGQIVIVISAPPRTNGAVRTVTFVDFYVNEVNIAGTRTITFSSGEGNAISATLVGELVITFPDGTYIERTTERVREFVEGYDTPGNYIDDKFQITGFTNSVSSEGFTFSATIVEPLIRIGTCRFIVQGVIAMAKNDEVMATLDYGDGTCDDVATITKDGVSKQITLGIRHRIRNK